MSTKAVLLNGPPRCGKDTIGEMLGGMVREAIPAEGINSLVVGKFAWPIVSYMWDTHRVNMHEVNKDLVHPHLHGRTPREVAIAYSEKLCKPLFGQDYFGKRFMQILDDALLRPKVCVLTDSGFASEAEVLVNALGQGNVLQVRIARPGCDFRIDSRSYWSSPRIGHVDFVNAGHSLVDLRKSVEEELLPQILEWYGK